MPSFSIKNIRLLHNQESRWLSEQMTGFIASSVGSNRREDLFYFFINILHHASGQNRIQTSIIKTFNNKKDVGMISKKRERTR